MKIKKGDFIYLLKYADIVLDFELKKVNIIKNQFQWGLGHVCHFCCCCFLFVFYIASRKKVFGLQIILVKEMPSVPSSFLVSSKQNKYDKRKIILIWKKNLYYWNLLYSLENSQQKFVFIPLVLCQNNF